MAHDATPDQLLGPYRVLDLTDEKGWLCGRMLAEMGADVVKIEQPGGDAGRNAGPFYEDVPHPERSLSWWAFNLGKRSITLALDRPEGREIFLRLASSADFVVESFPPGHLEGLGLGYRRLSALNPRIILTSITPFGQSGPYAGLRASDLTLQAMGGHMYVTGDDDRPPVRISAPVAYCHGGAEGAAASLIAHYAREGTGEGQHVDVSIQECVVWTLMNTTGYWDLLRRDVLRAGTLRMNPQSGLEVRQVWPCKDGFIAFSLLGGVGAARTRSFVRLVAWMADEGPVEPVVLQHDWPSVDLRTVRAEDYQAVEDQVGLFFRTKTIAELYQRAVEDGILIAPVATVKDVLESPQLAAREFFVEVEHPELGRAFRYPGAFARLSETPLKVGPRAPLAGEHNDAVYREELGYGPEALVSLRSKGII